MKKIYMIPTLQVVKIQPAQFIATSDSIPQGSNYTGSAVQARGASFSADDEDWED